MMKTVNLIRKCMVVGLLLTAIWGCSSANNEAPTLNAGGQHPAAWPTIHGAAYLVRAEQCYECHGRDLKGGISKVSCFSESWNGLGCHAGGPGGHPAGWGTPTVHGPHAKAKVGGADGFPYCQKCHGTLFDGGSAKKSCYTCHGVSAPHAPKPWRGGTYTHTTTDPSNAVACALCHTAGKNLTPALQQGVYATGAPGCFNNTLCHGPMGHPANWGLPANHGPSAKAMPSATQGFNSCKNCHGSDYAGGNVKQSCFTCHGVPAPHAPKPWRGGYYTHTTTDPGNADACADCHTAGANLTPGLKQSNYVSGTPGCFNSTLCHGAAGHPTGWANPDQHGGTAKSTPGTTSGFDYCRNCHGVSFAGGAGQTCLGTCHGSGVMAPHSKKPWSGTARTHTTTDPGNASICNICHNNGTNSSLKPVTPAPPGTSPGCFNSTLCHGIMSHPAGWNAPAVHGVHAKALVSSTDGFPRCQECHGARFDGGIVNKTCFTCHGVSAPHAPKPWRGGTYTHTTTDQSNVAVCALCHTAGANLTPSLKLPSYASGTPGCFNSTLCHGAVGHPAGWAAANQHGPAAKAAPSSSTGFSYCVTCHVDYKTGVGTSCFQCHTKAPHPGTPWRSLTAGASTHTTTDQGNAPQCARCHLNNARLTTPQNVPAGTSPGCFNNTLCHGQIAGHAFPYPGSAHKASAGVSPFTACTGCHTIGTAASPYPVAVGVKPDCMACHTKAAPVGNPTSGCYSCHGVSGNSGQPVGSAFPDRAGRHADHIGINGVTCATCHSGGGTGTATHGNSNRVKKNPTNVIVNLPPGITFTSNGSTTTGGGTCTGTCHEAHNGRTW
jgi:hypothetical protein